MYLDIYIYIHIQDAAGETPLSRLLSDGNVKIEEVFRFICL
jgi:hypothetical protein